MTTEFDLKMLKEAVSCSKSCPVSGKAYSVGAIITDTNNKIIATGYSRETSDSVHAEESAINKAVEAGIDLKGTTIYSTMEPCGLRLSGKLCCADRIINAGIARVVYGIDEPPFFVSETSGIDKLKSHGVIVEQIKNFNNEIAEINNHIK